MCSGARVDIGVAVGARPRPAPRRGPRAGFSQRALISRAPLTSGLARAPPCRLGTSLAARTWSVPMIPRPPDSPTRIAMPALGSAQRPAPPRP
eukprot:6747664-Pyramimonas_sp.AAC.1